MTHTAKVQFSDAEIARQSALGVAELRDDRYPKLRFRFLTDRTRGSWHVVIDGRWKKSADYPALKVKTMLTVLPSILARRAANSEASAVVGEFYSVGQVLNWYGDRLQRDRSLSAKRKDTCKSIIKQHLFPRLQDQELDTLSKSIIDTALLWPLQETLSVAYVRQVFGVLATALRTANSVGKIPTNPMAAMKFGDFVKAKIKPKSAQLRAGRLAELLEALAANFERKPIECMLPLMMLCHGTRIGETRVARKSSIDLGEREWVLPGITTKTRVEHVLPVTEQVAALIRRYLDLLKAKGIEGPYLFPNDAGKPLTHKQASEVFRALGNGEWTSHDLRKLARTSWLELGVDYLVGELLLNHSMGATAAAYIHTTAEELKRAALEKWHDSLDGRGFVAIHTNPAPRLHETTKAVAPSDGEVSSAISHQSKVRMQVGEKEVPRD